MKEKPLPNRAPRKPLRTRRANRRSTAPAEKPFARSAGPRATEKNVELVAGRAKAVPGGKRLLWHIFHRGRRAGRVSIYCVRRGERIDASIDVQLNQRSRGHGIGTIAFRRAAHDSGLPEVLASIRKSNVASRVAATRAGYVPLENQPSGELVLIWRRT
jgi:RimJ/RimL family protein N-acetyltransferase